MIDLNPLHRAIAGVLLGIVIASLARLRGALSRGGAVAAVIVAGACAYAGWTWAFLLIVFFVSSTLLSSFGRARKRAIAGDIVEKSAERDAVQVLANGGTYAILALIHPSLSLPFIQVAAAGALATSTADTWATEIGTLSRRVPRDILSWKPVPAGSSGGITWAGTIASLAGSAFIAVAALALGWGLIAACGAIIGGFTGALVDSVLGSRVQEKMWCPQCERGTERAIHGCGTITVRAGGIPGIGNDVVNFTSSVVGAIVGSICLI